jgi:hypothetical protein
LPVYSGQKSMLPSSQEWKQRCLLF